MSTVLQNLAALGRTAAIVVLPGEPVYFGITGNSLVGTIEVQRSVDGGATWQTVVLPGGVTFVYTDADADSATEVFTHDGPKAAHYSLCITAYTSGDADVDLESVDGLPVETVLRDAKGNPLIGLTRDGTLYFHAPLAVGSIVSRVTPDGDTPGVTADVGVTSLAPGASGTDLTLSAQLAALSVALHARVVELVYDFDISPADIIATTAGKFGHANGYEVVPSPGVGKALELVAAIVDFDRDTAAYTAGGNISVNLGGGGAAQTGVVSAANSLGNAADKSVALLPLTTVAIPLVANTGLNLVAAVAFTNPGTAAGHVKGRVIVRIHTLDVS